MTSDLKGKAVLITGASTGIGAAAARAFGRLGSRVAIHYNASRSAAEQVAADVRGAGAEALLIGGDLSKPSNAKRIVAEALAAFGRIDVLINNAGGLIKRTRIEDYSEEFLKQVINLNVVQVAMFMHEVIPVMRRQKERQRDQRQLDCRTTRRRGRSHRLRGSEGIHFDRYARVGEGGGG